jgi:DNA-binding MarR family transcriptional regulator/GNAT superfamily N-acetyltransferase
MKTSNLAATVRGVREFNRFYTKQIGVLDEHLLQSPFSLAEARVIYELAARKNATATELRDELGLDAGYLSRILQGLEKQKLVEKRSEKADARKNILTLSEKGRAEFGKLDKMSRGQLENILDKLSSADQRRILDSMRTIEQLFGSRRDNGDQSYILRPPQPGDLGWVVQANGRLYTEEYGWDETYEAMTAQIIADYVKKLDPKRERCWIAEKDGENVGSVFLVKQSATVARLRLLILDPKARGLGIGKRLVNECMRFARQTGYKKIVLWTQSNLLAARGIYKSEGYKLVNSQKNHIFGKNLISETWELKL